MNINTMAKVLHSYNFANEITSIQKYGYGRINKTWLVETASGKFILQKINSELFNNIPKLMNNIIIITEHLKTKNQNTSRSVLNIINNKHNKPFTKIDCEYFRVYEYIDNSICYQTSKNYDTIKKLGFAFGDFQKNLSDFDQSKLYTTIPNFHNTSKRYNDFINVLNKQSKSAILKNKALILKFIDKKKYSSLIQNLIERNEIPKRVTHNDTKLNNVIFDYDSKTPLAILDLDTVMPGTLLHDFGDAIRYCCNEASEEETELSKIKFDIDLYKSFCEGYICSMTDLTQTEINHLAISPLVMAYELGLRFLTDYLNGNKYFAIDYECQNFKRAQNQMKLLEDMENKYMLMQKIVSDTVNKIKCSDKMSHNKPEVENNFTDKYFSDFTN